MKSGRVKCLGEDRKTELSKKKKPTQVDSVELFVTPYALIRHVHFTC